MRGNALLLLSQVPDTGIGGGNASVEQSGGQKAAIVTSPELQYPKAQQGSFCMGKEPASLAFFFLLRFP